MMRLRVVLMVAVTLWPLAGHGGAYEDGLEYLERGRSGRAADLFEEAALAGHAGAQFMLGKMLLDGEGRRADPDQAVVWLDRAVANRSRDAALLLGNLYSAGLGVAADQKRSEYYLTLAADLLEPEDDGSDCE
jgi:TPR repeat protein